MNGLRAPITAQFLHRYDLLLLTSIIRLYFMELPECLFTFELYEPYKLLYANRKVLQLYERERVHCRIWKKKILLISFISVHFGFYIKVEGQDKNTRLTSISKLLATLPSCNYYTIHALFSHFNK